MTDIRLAGATSIAPMVNTRRSWGALALAAATLIVGTYSVSLGGVAHAGNEAPPDTSEPTTTTTSTTTTTTTLPLAGEVLVPAHREDMSLWEQVMETLPPPPTTTTTIPYNPCASTDVPANSGTGRRAIYSKSCQRVWLVEDNGSVARTFRVSGRLTWNQPTPNNPNNPVEPSFRFYNSSNVPAFYRVASRSGYTCNINKPYLCWQYMVRFTKGGDDGDNIGFHQIPIDTRSGRPVQTLAQLGQPLSGGCIRQAPEDAKFTWDWAWMHTKVVVLA